MFINLGWSRTVTRSAFIKQCYMYIVLRGEGGLSVFYLSNGLVFFYFQVLARLVLWRFYTSFLAKGLKDSRSLSRLKSLFILNPMKPIQITKLLVSSHHQNHEHVNCFFLLEPGDQLVTRVFLQAFVYIYFLRESFRLWHEEAQKRTKQPQETKVKRKLVRDQVKLSRERKQ